MSSIATVGIYKADQTILLVGEADFSFALSLAKGFGTGLSIIATALDMKEEATAKYSQAASNITQLLNLGATIFFQVDATQMNLHEQLSQLRFDRILFQFPHCAIDGKKPQSTEVRQAVRDLLSAYLKNAADLVTENGEIHTTLRTPKWNIEELGQDHVIYVGKTEFSADQYEGYKKQHCLGDAPDGQNKPRCCFTFKFSKRM